MLREISLVLLTGIVLLMVQQTTYGLEMKTLSNGTQVIDHSVPPEGRLVGVTGPMKCHKLPGGGFGCESGDWIPVISNGNKAISPYDAGHEHGVSDAKMEKINPASRSLYIVQPGKNLYGHTQNFTWGYTAGYCSLQPCPEKDSSNTTTPHPGLNPNSFNMGLRYGFNDWNIHVPGGKWEMSQPIGSKPYAFECPLAHTAPHSNFCNGYDAALVYENSDY